ncbi:hypothetical protein GWR56_04815 [Mucilaginibacter sp. 14171R-50]|uniref:FKBP-type peptidyl-prolyl cis-trans isomerase n=1 Tax=Mucilaginibacter sp. 14171R-50 TaxID=2703789 RepID=UPI00138CF1E0|nr:FKBP-type peptidyl-prolyl cis-trans isomerase [Mucilaginibacter sp. 14171R-50]QHS54901.1 hypothetical protein GWR56_04815 [Mucilaginibacter sp. 14171R-50]
MKKYFFILSVLVIGLASCSKNSEPEPIVDPAVQAKTDDDAIVAYLSAHTDITAVKDLNHPELYYQVLAEGTGDPITENSQLVVSYTGKTLSGATFDARDDFSLKLSQNIIAGWKIGVPKIKNGGKILLIIPSALGYGPYANGPLPANTVLVFTITIKSVDGHTPSVDPI